MAEPPALDVAAAHRHFSAHCFNRAWDLIEKDDRTAEDDRLMVALSQASIFHWTERPDCTARNMSIGYWQASRIAALVGDAAGAARHAETCMAHSADLLPFYRGYANEAVARAALLEGDDSRAAANLAAAEALLSQISRQEDRERLAADLAQLRGAVVKV